MRYIGKIKYQVICFLLSLLVGSCSVSKQIGNSENLKFEPVKINAWIDLMPNAGEKFYLAGNVKLISVSEDLKKVSLSTINIFQNDSLLIEINPVSNSENIEDDTLLMNFSMEYGVAIKDQLEDDQPITLEFVFIYDGNKFIREVNDVEVEKVY